VHQLLRGYSLREGIEKPIEVVKRHYLGKAGNAIISALKDLYKQYDGYADLK
jgi:hypothetical protein